MQRSVNVPGVIVVSISLFATAGSAAVSVTTVDPQPDPTGVDLLNKEASNLNPLVKSELGKVFLYNTSGLPRIETRTLYRDPKSREWFTPAERAAMPAERRAALEERPVDEDLYYQTFYGSPLVYVRLLDLLSEAGVADLEGKRVLDFGYGSVGHLRLMAMMGADAVGTEVSSALRAFYSRPEDQYEEPRRCKRSGRVSLVNGRWPGEPDVAAAVGAGFDIITSKNTLKNGYLNPSRPVDKRRLLNLGVDHDTFVEALHRSLKPGGFVLIYNLCPAPSKDDEPYKPWADGRCPFPRGMWTAAGFRIIEFDKSDDETGRAIFKALGSPTTSSDGADNLFVWYTLLQKSDK